MESQAEPKGPKDCRVCHSRRIKCDRSLPTCKKCAKKNIVCSGYGLILKWNQGVASRGRLTGKSVPLPLERATISIEPSFESHNRARERGGDEAAIVSRIKSSAPPQKTKQCQFGISVENELFTASRNTAAVTQYLQISNGHPLLPALLNFPSPLLQNYNVRFLLHHYNQVVAANMTWADSSENEWRDVIIPMALESPLVLSSILAFAAKHISAMANSTSMERLLEDASNYSMVYRNQALNLLARELRQLTSENHGSSSISIVQDNTRQRYNILLAAMLVLCNVETVKPDSSIWQVHLNAARTVISTRIGDFSIRDSKDPTTIFLKRELFIANTFASLTIFSQPNNEDIWHENSGGPFGSFLKLLHRVTRMERQAFNDPETIYASDISPDGFRQLFENARARTLTQSSTLRFSLPDSRLQFNGIVNSFYHSGLIYSYRALFSYLPSITSQIKTSTTELFQILNHIEMDKPVYAQDLVWPLFIAGTEASRHGDREMVVRKLEQAMRGTGFSNCEKALEFLRAFWAEKEAVIASMGFENGEEVVGCGWISFAREWERRGHVFWVF